MLGLPREGEFALRRVLRVIGGDLGFGPPLCPDRDPAVQTSISATVITDQKRG